MLTYEQRLAKNPRWALSEGSRHFERQSSVQQSLEKIAKRLEELEIPYAVAGAMAMFQHGYRRFTEDVDILVTKDGLKKIHRELEGLGYVPPFTGSKNLRDAELGVRIEFIISGGFPGDGKPKPVAFPDPEDVGTTVAGIRIVALPKLVELKLASGLSSPDRAKDIGDVQEIIKVLRLPKDFVNQLHPYVQDKYRDLWVAVNGAAKRYVKIWRNKFLTLDAQSLEEMAATLRAAADELAAMRADGVTLDPKGDTADDYAFLVTEDPDIAAKYDMHEESEFLDEDDDENQEHAT